MSRQYDQAMEGCFELYGKRYRIIEPENVEELKRAFEVKSAIETHISTLMHDEDSSGYESLLQEQIDYIHEYGEQLGEFNNSTLAYNIAFLVKKYNLRVGELEEAIGVSVGYLSRTLKENSKKKMSIDIVWKIAQLFETDIRTLTEKEMWTARTNTDLLERFLDRLYEETQDNIIIWEIDGADLVILDNRYIEMGLVTEDEDIDEAVYHPNHLNQTYKWIIADDIYSLKSFDGKKDLAMIPFRLDGKDEIFGYDFVFIWKDDEKWCWEKAFYTSDDPFETLKDSAHRLYKLIESRELDAKISPRVHQLISSYLMGGDVE